MTTTINPIYADKNSLRDPPDNDDPLLGNHQPPASRGHYLSYSLVFCVVVLVCIYVISPQEGEQGHNNITKAIMKPKGIELKGEGSLRTLQAKRQSLGCKYKLVLPDGAQTLDFDGGSLVYFPLQIPMETPTTLEGEPNYFCYHLNNTNLNLLVNGKSVPVDISPLKDKESTARP